MNFHIKTDFYIIRRKAGEKEALRALEIDAKK